MALEYPPAPWTLRGTLFHTIQLVPIAAARELVPAPLRVVPVWPSRTIGGVCIGRYGPGSTLEYGEMIVAPALVYYGGRIGFWISEIYVDSVDSMRGGREIWGLPKQLADFRWEEDRVTISRKGSVLVSVRIPERQGVVPVIAPITAFGMPEGAIRPFSAAVRSRICVSRTQWESGVSAAPLASLASAPRLTILHNRMSALVHAPRGVTR